MQKYLTAKQTVKPILDVDRKIKGECFKQYKILRKFMDCNDIFINRLRQRRKFIDNKQGIKSLNIMK